MRDLWDTQVKCVKVCYNSKAINFHRSQEVNGTSNLGSRVTKEIRGGKEKTSVPDKPFSAKIFQDPLRGSRNETY
jgi:hypothetical protein